MFGNGPSNADAVVGGGATANFVHDDEAIWSGEI